MRRRTNPRASLANTVEAPSANPSAIAVAEPPLSNHNTVSARDRQNHRCASGRHAKSNARGRTVAGESAVRHRDDKQYYFRRTGKATTHQDVCRDGAGAWCGWRCGRQTSRRCHQPSQSRLRASSHCRDGCSRFARGHRVLGDCWPSVSRHGQHGIAPRGQGSDLQQTSHFDPT